MNGTGFGFEKYLLKGRLCLAQFLGRVNELSVDVFFEILSPRILARSNVLSLGVSGFLGAIFLSLSSSFLST